MEELEEGQIAHDHSANGYDPAFEWPGESETSREYDSTNLTTALRPGQPIFRLVVLRSSILSRKKKVAVIDSYPEVQLGRDVQPEGSSTPRIRLKEMQVSKIHATAYWDGARKEWNIVDMGSMHGTFLRPGTMSPDSEGIGTRLSQPRMASIPKRLRHSDQLKLGTTTFEVHIHDNQRPCGDCALTEDGEIPLFPVPKKASMKRTRDAAGIDSDTSAASPGFATMEKDPKKALTMLKRSLLTRHNDSQHASTSTAPITKSEYVDRAARRRLLHPASRPDSPGVASITTETTRKLQPALTGAEEQVPNSVTSQPPTPLPPENIGHRLLMQQGWAPGTSLGAPSDPEDGRIGLVEPLELKSSQNRSGLGMKSPPADTDTSISGLDWKEREKLKRFGAFGR
ncbi:Angiogenic factor with G patch and FHA domains 1 [Psilocybe cubensis]|uniref:Angiogenic factor with G patch and FHA domains 1 n=2 Tax=Psilocybe cubensis TaxID=181762 RepID=A0A8H8CMN3_PSICU|nr:Angiogenic factor with G patch and FHA domains 1 [Psilocybe cubensis]KAH9481444.1 Angiogenic factor with G patch and FHA domains 1 [Psilocybe cubensis]